MAVGKYIHKNVRYGLGRSENLIKEGVAGGRSWALVKMTFPDDPSQGEQYILRVDLSEWWHAYNKCYEKLNHSMFRFGEAAGIKLEHSISLNNISPCLWDNGFGVAFYMNLVIFKYKSETDRFVKTIESGVDWESIDYGRLVLDLLEKMKPGLDLFKASVSGPLVPEKDF